MKEKEFRKRGNKPGLLLFAAATACLIISGCAGFGPYYLNKEVIKYDEAVLQSEQQMLLLNILRMHDDQPAHFTAASGIQANFTLSSTGTLGPLSYVKQYSSGMEDTSTGTLSLAGTITNNPSITIAPIQGKDFADRFLSPIDTKFVYTIMLQHSELDKLLRLAGIDFNMIRPERSEKLFKAIADAKGIIKDDEFKKVSDFAGNERVYEYPFNIFRDNNKLSANNELIEKLRNKGFSQPEASCLLEESDCYMKNTPPKIISAEDKNNIKREADSLHYQLFRRIVLHIKAVQKCYGLYFTLIDIPVQSVQGTYRKNINFGKDGFKDTIDLYEKQYFWQDASEQDNTGPEKKDVTRTESEEISKTETKEVNKTDKKEAVKAEPIKTEEKEVNTKSVKKEETEPAEQDRAFVLKKNYTIIALTDFDWTLMDNKSKQIITKQIQDDCAIGEEMKLGESIILVLIRGGGDNGWPIYGYFALRNFRQVLQFLAESITEQPGYTAEYNVPPSKFTVDLLDRFNDKPYEAKLSHGCLENPEQTLAIYNSKVPGLNPPIVSVDHNGLSYWIATRQKRQEPTNWVDIQPLRWDGQVFSLLYEMFEFNKNAPAFTNPLLTIPAAK